MAMLNQFKFTQQAYYPFSLSFQEPEYYWRFLQGEFIVMVLIDYAVVEEIAASNGYSIQPAEADEMMFQLNSIKQDVAHPTFLISEHYFFRVFMEFVSMKWLISEACTLWERSVQLAAEEEKHKHTAPHTEDKTS